MRGGAGAKQTLQGYGRFARAAFQASPGLSGLTVAASVLTAAAPLISVGGVGVIVSKVPDLRRGGLGSPAGRSAIWWAIGIGGLFLLQWAAGGLRLAASTALGDRVDHLLQRRLMAAVTEPVGIAHLEDSHRRGLIDVGRDTFRVWTKPGRLAATLSELLAGRVVLVGASALLIRFHWWLGVAFLGTALWVQREDKVASRREASHHYGGTEDGRRSEYYYQLGVNPPAAKEVRVFGLPDFLLGRYQGTWERAMVPVFAKAGIRPLLAATVLGAATLAVLAVIILDARHHHIGIGLATVYAQAIVVGLSGLGRTSFVSLQSELVVATLQRYEAAASGLVTADPPFGQGATEHTTAVVPATAIRFEAVSFAYPGTDRAVLHGLDLSIPIGRSLAIVGANGAGKSTLIKLLCRLYEPSSGAITVDGRPLSSIDPYAWRGQLAAVFQDSVQFQMSAEDNVGLGAVHARRSPTALRAAARAAGIAEVIEALPDGWSTVLSTNYSNGVDLSGGEWQKLALARALYAVANEYLFLVKTPIWPSSERVEPPLRRSERQAVLWSCWARE